jgi:type I site-specific restriction endonuclease
MSMLTEADTCRKYVLPKLYAAGWTDDQISEQKSFTDGRIVVAGAKPTRRLQKRADYLLKYRRDFTLAVVEAKSVYKRPGGGLQQAKEYAQILGLKFAYSTNGHGIVEHDFFDLAIVDECHRGSARDESNWREILEYFEPAYQLGMTEQRHGIRHGQKNRRPDALRMAERLFMKQLCSEPDQILTNQWEYQPQQSSRPNHGRIRW